MKADFTKIKPIAGLFLEALMLVFIFVYSHAEVPSSTSPSKDSPLTSALTSLEIVLRNNESSSGFNQVLPHSLVFMGLFPSSNYNLPGIKLAWSSALCTHRFIQSNFYLVAAEHVP